MADVIDVAEQEGHRGELSYTRAGVTCFTHNLWDRLDQICMENNIKNGIVCIVHPVSVNLQFLCRFEISISRRNVA